MCSIILPFRLPDFSNAIHFPAEADGKSICSWHIFPIRRTEAFDDNVNINRKGKMEGMPDISTVEV
jgi:hypothetical protein